MTSLLPWIDATCMSFLVCTGLELNCKCELIVKYLNLTVFNRCENIGLTECTEYPCEMNTNEQCYSMVTSQCA